MNGGEEPPEPIARFIANDEDVSDENTSLGLDPFELTTGRDRCYHERRLALTGADWTAVGMVAFGLLAVLF